MVAKFFSNKRKDANYIPDDETEIKHVDAALKLLSAMTGDHSYEEILVQGKDGNNMSCTVAQNLLNIGRKEGRAEGQMRILIGLVKDGVITMAGAAKRTKMSEEDFIEKVKMYEDGKVED